MRRHFVIPPVRDFPDKAAAASVRPEARAKLR